MYIQLLIVFFSGFVSFVVSSTDIQTANDEQSDSSSESQKEVYEAPKSILFNNKDDYEKPIVYKYLLEPFVHLDQSLQNPHFKITHCSVVKESDLKSVKTYAGLGSCLLDQIPFSSKEVEKVRSIIAYAIVNESVNFDFLITWKSFDFMDIVSSYWNENLNGLPDQISIKSPSQENLLELVNYFIEFPQILNESAGFSPSNLDIKEIKLQVRVRQMMMG